MAQSMEALEEHAQILEAAAEEFADHGFKGARMDSIAERADVNKASIYYHLGNKEELYEAVFLSLLESVGERFEEINEQLEQSDETIENNLRMMLTEVGNHLVENDHYRILLSDIVIGDRDIPEPAVEQAIENAETFRSVFQQGVDEDVFRDHSPLATYLTFFSSVLFFTAMKSQISEIASLVGDQFSEQIEGEKVPSEILDLIFEGLLTEDHKDD
jgi:AcrR family transcriptional regulator